MDKEKIKLLVEKGLQEFEKVRISPTTYSLAVAFELRDILEDIKKEVDS
jgi:hypothetical protein